MAETETGPENKPETAEQRKRRWANTRRMAWLAMIAGCLFPVLLVISENPELGKIAWPFYVFMGSVVGVYVGFSTAEDKWRK